MLLVDERCLQPDLVGDDRIIPVLWRKRHLGRNNSLVSEFWNRAGPTPARMGDSHYDGLRCPLAGAVSVALRNHAGKGVQQVNEGIPARWTLKASASD